MSPKRMKAAVVHKYARPLSLEEVAVPRPGPGQILVKIAASGVCHTDVHAAEGDDCLAAGETLCPRQQNTGYAVNGGYAEDTLAPAADVGRNSSISRFGLCRADSLRGRDDVQGAE